MSVRIVTDSTCDLPEEVITGLGIRVIPFYIRVRDRDYLDGIDLTRDEFYDRLPHFPHHPTTAVPSPHKFRAAYDALAAEGAAEVLSIHISSTLSATMDVARAAARETTSVPVTVFDSHQLSLGMGFLAETAAGMAREGCSVGEILPVLEEQVRNTHVWALLDTLKYLRRSGRMNSLVATIGELLHVKPILRMYDGVSGAEKVRTRKKGLDRLALELKSHAPYEKLAILYSGAAGEVEVLQGRLAELQPGLQPRVGIINPVLGAHIGTGVLGFAGVSKR